MPKTNNNLGNIVPRYEGDKLGNLRHGRGRYFYK